MIKSPSEILAYNLFLDGNEAKGVETRDRVKNRPSG
jgi:hypothetical protein